MKNKKRDAFQKDLIISVLIHLFFFIFFLCGLPSILTKFSTKERKSNVPIFEMLTVSDLTNIIKGNKSESEENKKLHGLNEKRIAPSEEESLKEREKAKMLKNSEISTKNKKINIPLKEDDFIKKKTQKEFKKKNLKEEDLKGRKKRYPNIKEENKLLEVKKVSRKKSQKRSFLKKDQEDLIDSLLVNLEKDLNNSELNNSKQEFSFDENCPIKSNQSDSEELSLSIMEKLIIRKQIEDKWTQVFGNLQNVKVTLNLELDKSGFITGAKLKKFICPLDSEVCSVVLESVERAVKRANRITNLNPNRYDVWKSFDLDFCPSDM